MDYSTFKVIKGIAFGVYTAEEIKKLSVLEITNTEILDSLGHPTTGGLHDLRLGPNEKDDFCQTCGLNFFQCPGHTGHITFPVPVYNPVFFPRLYQLLKGSCLYCHRLLAPTIQLHLALYQLQALDYGLVSTVKELAEVITDTDDQKISSSDFVSYVESKLKQKYNAAIEGLDLTELKQPVRSVVECKREILKTFTQKYMMTISGKCPHCKMPRKKISRHNMRIVYLENKSVQVTSSQSSAAEDDKEKRISEFSNKEITPDDARKHLHALWENDKIFLQQLFKILYQDDRKKEMSIDMFFMDVIMVPPSKFRRLNVMKGRKYADSQTSLLNEILKDCHLIRNLFKFYDEKLTDQAEKDVINKLPGKGKGEKYSLLYQQLQRHVNELFDSDTNKTRTKVSKGIKQILEKKEGLFRMNMMGKRVNYAARSVISPDPYIDVNEIGIPMVFAKTLTFPEPVNQWNYEKLRLAVKNGPSVYPGAFSVVYEDGRVVRLTDDANRRQAIANTLLTPPASTTVKKYPAKIVHRHLRDGDMLLLNRQPTLHKPSIMAHKARVLPGEKTLRLHYANCKSYNADFDGDEMNAHFPQSYLGQAECRHIVSVNHQYLVPKDGTALSGLIQDHIIGGTLLTMRGKFFKKDEYHKLIHSALACLTKRLKILPPAIIKPEKLWSGKQVVSTVIINLIPEGKTPPTVKGKAKVPAKKWQNSPARPWMAGGTPFAGDCMGESEVVIRNGELLCGIIDKAQVGPTPYSLIHVCYELYGGETSSLMLTCLARLFTYYLQTFSGFSLGIEDLVVTKKADKQRKRIIKRAASMGMAATAKALEVDNLENPAKEEIEKKYKDAHFNRDDFGLKTLDMAMKEVTQNLNNDIKDVCMPIGLIKQFPSNNLQLMIESGAKGSMVNALQISCLLGQIELEGRRMPLTLNGNTLPSFLPYDTSPAAGGFVSGRFLTGIDPREYFFHCMAGREGLIDTAVKTSRSGYLQRCLIKHLEGINVNYDLTVRDCDGTVIQFQYGEDGLDVLKTQMLKENSLHLLAENYSAAANEDLTEMFKSKVDVNLPKLKKQIKRWNKKHPNPKIRTPLIQELPSAESISESKASIQSRVQRLTAIKEETDQETLKDFKKATRRCPDPVNSEHRPDLVFGSVSEKLDEMISNYISKRSESFSNAVPEEKIKDMFYYRALRSLAEPGETVGLLAAQSIGEPSTQMTLNTFHFAGKGEMNVTLGIPRLREILMTASPNIATPTMDLPLLDKPGILEKAEKLRLRLNPVSLKAVLDSVKIKEYLSIHATHMKTNFRNYVIRLNFLKHSVYKGLIYTSPSKILYYVEHHFIKRLIEAIKKKRRQTSSSTLVGTQKDSSGGFNRFTKTEDTTAFDSAPVADEPRAADDGDSSGAESDGDGDATSAKQKMRHDQELEYEEPEDEEILPEESGDDEEKDEVEIKKEINTSDEEKTAEQYSDAQNTSRSSKYISPEDKALRINAFRCINSWIFNYDFDTKNERWCEISLQVELDSIKIDMKTLLEEEVSKAYVHSVPNIKEALLVKNPNATSDCNMMLKTNGVNFLEVFKHADILDMTKAYSNNIHSIAEIYGIEAAANALKKEIVNVFKPYNITVDPRHLSLLTDYMTSSGCYRPCNRIGMEGSASPLQQMTFETTKNFLVDAMLLGVEERLKGPSANIIVGQLCRAGTGSFDLLAKLGKQP